LTVGFAVCNTLDEAEGSIVGFKLGVEDDGTVEGNADGIPGLRLLPVMDGAVVGAVCSMVGIRDGYALGTKVATVDGLIVGLVGLRLGIMLGTTDGRLVIDAEGVKVGLVGEQVGSLDGFREGCLLEAIDGAFDGKVEGV